MGIVIKKLKKNEIAAFKEKIDNNKYISEYSPFSDGTIDEFEWQFFNSTGDNALYFVAEDEIDNEIIGTMAALIIPMKMPDESIELTIKPEDVLVSIKGVMKYKGIDILKELLDTIERETESKKIKFYWGFTEAVVAFERIGFSNEFSSQQGILVFKPFKAYDHLKTLNSLNKYKQKILIFGLSVFSYIKVIIVRKTIKSLRCEKILFEDLNESILLSFLPKKVCSIYLNMEFLRWRIIENPSKIKYHLLQIINSVNEIISYLIYSEKQEGVFFIEQFLFKESLFLKQKKEAAMVAVNFLGRQKAIIIRTMGFTHNNINKEECEILNSIGFIYVKKGIPFILKSKFEIKSEDIYLSRLNTQGTF